MLLWKPVEKRIDNLKPHGPHSCGKCYPLDTEAASTAELDAAGRLVLNLPTLKHQLTRFDDNP